MRQALLAVAIILLSVAAVAAANNPADVGHTLGEIKDSNTLCKTSGAACPDRTGSLSCTEVAGSWATSNANSGESITSTAGCDSGTTVTGGGCEAAVTAGSAGRQSKPDITFTRKNSNGWKCTGYGDTGDKVRAFARCCKMV